MRFPNWVCKDCGRSFGRKWNGERHIVLLHSGCGSLVSFMDYMLGRQAGIYPASRPASYERKKINDLDIFREEFNRELARERVRQLFHREKQQL